MEIMNSIQYLNPKPQHKAKHYCICNMTFDPYQSTIAYTFNLLTQFAGFSTKNYRSHNLKSILISDRIQKERIYTQVLSWRTKDEKLLCLKYLGKRSLANSGVFHTTKLLLPAPQETTASVDGSSTISYVLLRKGGGPAAIAAGEGATPFAPAAADEQAELGVGDGPLESMRQKINQRERGRDQGFDFKVSIDPIGGEDRTTMHGSSTRDCFCLTFFFHSSNSLSTDLNISPVISETENSSYMKGH